MARDTTRDALDLAPTRTGGHPLARCPVCDAVLYGYPALGGGLVVCDWPHERSCAFRLVVRPNGHAGGGRHR